MDIQALTQLQAERTELNRKIAAVNEQIRQVLDAAASELNALRASVGLAPDTEKRSNRKARSAETRARHSEAMRRRWAIARANGQMVNAPKPVAAPSAH